MKTGGERYLMLYWFTDSRPYARQKLSYKIRSLQRRGMTIEKPARGVVLGGRAAVGVIAGVVRELGGRYRVFRVVEEATDSLEVIPL